MGQQQLLLIILVTIIVGIAAIVAINTFGSAADQANIDAVTKDMATLGSSAQTYFYKAELLDGGGRSFIGVSFKKMPFPATGISQDGLVAENENGRYYIESVEADEFIIRAVPAGSPGYTTGTLSNGVLTPGQDGSGSTLTARVLPMDYQFGAVAE